MQQLLKLVPIVGIFVFVSMAWLVLSGTMLARSQSQHGSLSHEVGNLWGGHAEPARPGLQPPLDDPS